MRMSASSSGATISGSVGGQKGSVGVGSNGTVSIGIDTVGIKLGVTNDYGGAGSIGFGGQSVTWGVTGGNIKLGIGGFEVFVEARDCIVVETKKIAGMIISQRSYPDPGCKQPKPPDRKPPESELPQSPSEKPLQKRCENGDYIAAVSFNKKGAFSTWGDQFNYWDAGYDWWTVPIKEYLEWRDQALTATGGMQSWDSQANSRSGGRAWIKDVIPGRIQNIRQHKFTEGVWQWQPKNTSILGNKYLGDIPAYRAAMVHVSFSRIAYRFISSAPGDYFFTGPWVNVRHTIVEVYPAPTWGCIPLVEKPLVLPSAGNRPPMRESCCESLKADIEDIKEVLATKEMLAKKLTFPWRLRMPGGEGDEIITDYPNLARCIAQMIDHLGIHPPKLSIKDINNAVAGDQSIENQFPSGTQAFEALMAQVWDANADVDTLTNFLYRLSWLSVQQSMNLARVSGDIQCIKDMFGGETEPAETSITTPFNIGAGVKDEKAPTKGKGFGKKPGAIDQSIEANTELSTEKLFPAFLKIRENPIIVQAFTGNKDVFDFLAIIILKLEKLENR